MSLSVACSAVLILYLIGSLILILSTMSVFEYGSHYFHEKFKIIERHHTPEIYVKETVISNNGCQGYVPHIGAMITLILLAICKGPLLYDLVSLMRLTDDQLLQSGITCEVLYMVFWLFLWLGLTIKQQWQFRILDYVPLKQKPFSSSSSDDALSSTRSGQMSRGDMVNVANFIRNKRMSPLTDNPTHRYSDPLPGGFGASSDPSNSELGTDDSDIGNNVDVVLDLDGNPILETGRPRRPRHRRPGCQRVTFDKSVRSRNDRLTSSLPRHVTCGQSDDSSNMDVRADVHTPQTKPAATHDVVARDSGISESKLSNREYRNSIKNKCGEYYSSCSNLGESFDDPAPLPDPAEPLPTLMSSFRDKVRESSIAASNFKEREKNMMERYSSHAESSDSHTHESGQHESDKRRCISMSDNDDTYKLCSISSAVVSSNSRPADVSDVVIYGRDASLFPNASHRRESPVKTCVVRKKHNMSMSSEEDQGCDVVTNSSLDSRDLATLQEDIQSPRGIVELSGSRLEMVSVGNKHLPPSLQPHPQHVFDHPSKLRQTHAEHLLGSLQPRPVHVVVSKKAEIGRRDSANYSLTSSQDTSSTESDHGGATGLCSQV